MSKVYCDRCDEYEKSYPSLSEAQSIANTHGWIYKGIVFKYCPWCGFTLKDKK